MTAPREIALFLDMMAAERGAAANTLDAYRRDLEDVAARLAGLGSALSAAGTADLEGVLAGMASDAMFHLLQSHPILHFFQP